VAFETPVQPLNGGAAVVDGLPLRSFDSLGVGFLVTRIRVNDGFSPILPLNQMTEFITGVASVADDVVGMELAIGESSLSQQDRGALHIRCVTLGNVNNHRQFIGGITEDVNLVTPYVLGLALGVLLHYPTSIGVRNFPRIGLTPFLPGPLGFPAGLGSIRPSLDVGAVNGDRLAESRQGFVEIASQTPQDIFDGKSKGGPGQLGPKAGESRLTGDFFGTVNSASFGNVGIIVELPDQSGNGIQSQVVIDHVAVPKDCGIVSLGATSPGACELGNEFPVRKFMKDCLKLTNNWRELSISARYSIIKGDHREVTPSCWLGAVGADNTCGSALFIAEL
jgi:hypothetical protein